MNDLSASDFAKISSQVSVGVNAWVLHNFVPDFYAYEPVADSSLDQFQTLRLMSRSDVIARKPHLVFLKPRDAVEKQQLDMIPRELISRTHLYGRFQPYTRSLANLEGDLTKSREKHRSASSVMLDSGASIVRLTWLGVVMGFREIVLVGVDLYGSDYFWETDVSHLLRNGLTSWNGGQKPGLHETMNQHNRAFRVYDMLVALASVFRKEGVRLSVASERSLLVPSLEQYRFSAFPQEI